MHYLFNLFFRRTSSVSSRTGRSSCIREADENRNSSSSVSFVDSLMPLSDNGFTFNKDELESIDAGTWSDSSSRFADSLHYRSLDQKSARNSCEKTSEVDRTELLKGSAQDRTFEKSLDNVMDKISDRSYDLSIHFDKNSFSDTGRDDESRSLKQGKAEKKRKSSSWYSVSVI